ncbi:MAG: hypothetical protein RQ966_11135 [Acetobacteraceae bacterium]|nr:hypothetical protein [Acetobacteraceae bacterium]
MKVEQAPLWLLLLLVPFVGLLWVPFYDHAEPIAFADAKYSIYIGLTAVEVNIVVATAANVVLPRGRPVERAEIA